MKMKSHLNKAQTVCLQSYATGDFAHLLEIESKESFDAAIDDCGDTLLRFLMIELSTSEDCDSTETAVRRIMTTISDLKVVSDAIESLPKEYSWPTPPRG